MDEPRKKFASGDKAARKENVEVDSASTKNRQMSHGDRSPKPKDGEKLRERLAKSKHVWRKESMEKRPKSGPLVARHSINRTPSLRLDTTIAHTAVSRSSLRPTSPTYESAFKRHVLNRPHSPVVGLPSRRVTPNSSFNRGHKRSSSPHAHTNPEEVMKKRIEKAKRAKLYLLQQAGPNTFIIGGGESRHHRHKVTIGPQACTCGRGPHCIHILFVMVRVFQLSHGDNLIQSKLLKNFEVESLFRKYETRRKQRLTRATAATQSSSSTDSEQAAALDASVDLSLTDYEMASLPTASAVNVCTELKMEATCPICLLDLVQSSQLVHCEHCHNRLHNDCMAVWYQLVKKQGEVLTCPLCRAIWSTVDTISFSEVNSTTADTLQAAPVYNPSPNSLGTSPVSGFEEIEPSTLLPKSQPIPEEQSNAVKPWVEMFGEDLIGCLFMKNEWVMRETALRHLSREMIMLLSHPSEEDMTSSPTGQSSITNSCSGPSNAGRRSFYQSRIESVLEIGCQILSMMMSDPVYKVYVACLRSLRTMLCYCTLPDVTKLRLYMQPVIRSIILKCADGNRKTNQLSISTLCEFAKDQEGELAIGRELNVAGQTGLGGCMYVLECCTNEGDVDNVQIQWLNGRLLIINQLLENHPNKFSLPDISETQLDELARQTLFPLIEFAVMAVTKAGNQPRTLKYAKKVIIQCSKYLSAIRGMNSKIKALLTRIEPDLRGRLEKWLVEIAINAHQVALDANNRQQTSSDAPDMSEPRVGSPPPQQVQVAPPINSKRSLTFGSLYQATSVYPLPKTKTSDSHSTSKLPRHKSLYHRRSDSYTEAVHNSKDVSKTRSLDDSNATSPSRPNYDRQSSSSDSAESVEADYAKGTNTPDHTSQLQTDRLETSPFTRGEADEELMVDDGDITLTETAGLGASDGEVNEVEYTVHKSPRKISRGRVVSGNKPMVNRRSDHGGGDCSLISTNSDEQEMDVMDGLYPHRPEQQSGLHEPPVLHTYQSMGFEAHNQLEQEPTTLNLMQPIEQATDSESCTDNISQSVSLSVSPATSDDEYDELSANEFEVARVHKKNVPFGEYRRVRHTRSKTDPFKFPNTNKSPRCHSDPAVGDSTTSSSASTPRSPVRESSPQPLSARTAVNCVEVAPVKPVSRSLTFSQASQSVRRPASSRHQSMRASRGSGSQLPRSRLPSRSKTAMVAPPPADPPTPLVASDGPAKSKPQSSSPPLPAAIRALTPPNSPLKAAKSSTPLHTPPASPNSLISRSPSPTAPITAIVRPQAKHASQVSEEEKTEATSMVAPQVRVEDVEPSRPIQRQMSTIDARITALTSSSSDDHKPSNDSLYVEDLSDSAVASPYEKEVSFKSEVALFSPRSSVEDGNCQCKDEVELEEAIALAKAMEISTDQTALPQVPGLSVRRQEETITIHIQQDETDSRSDQVEYLEDVHWRRGMRIGTGAFSTCYQCRDVKTGIIMAVKQISFCRNSESEQDSICKAVIDEIRMMATLNHPNIVRILGATQTGAHFNMFVEWMPGGSVSHILERYGSFSEPVITSYTQQVLMGLAYLHDHQILHRDMKGANLLVDSTGRHLRIGDFGACAQLASSMTGAGELRGQLLGTIAFMAPEVLRGEHYGRACDVWSVGCVIIEMVTTKPPWNASNVSNHLKLIFTIASANASPPIPENLPPGIKDLMLRCLEPESKHRPPAKELLQHPLFTRSQFRRR